MKILTFYLPQFHEIPENNEWWGENFTEWTNVKKAKSYFRGHYQPREPYNDNYYNLLNKETMKDQVEMAQKYGIYGFCFYHYWFEGGKKVLEKPTELLLENRNIKFPFCFAWANESWTRTWHGAKGEKEVLIQQRYGKEQEWKQHFDYLLNFFKDERYIKIENKPVFLVYRINTILCFDRMVDYWNKLAKDNGFDGIYLVGMITGNGKLIRNKRVSATVDFEPGQSRKNLGMKNKAMFEWKEEMRRKVGKYKILNNFFCNTLSYKQLNTKMIEKTHAKNEFRGAFVNYDDTPRRGIDGIICKGSTPQRFKQYLKKQIQLSKKEGNEFLFLNAWNEWGEGNYLEPDKKYKYMYLQAVKEALEEE